MKSTLQLLARELGFDACGVTSAQAPASAHHFQKWLASGCHGEMTYLARNAAKRIDPQQVLAGARSIITLAASYARETRGELTATSPPTDGEFGGAPSQAAPGGVIARYARYTDYHQVMGDRLQTFTTQLNEMGDADTRSLWYVDTGPLLERDLAERAGLGFIGKHTGLISRQLGNWFFLAEIITTLELAPDPPERNRCGSCTRCLTACPTQAITAPFQLDARRCISYLTIELKGSIPLELRPAIGNRIYGCDDCLAACPWNRFAREGRLMREHVRPELDAPELIELLALDNEGFKRRFAGTPIARAKRRGLLRNVCVALGNSGDPGALPALRIAAQDPEPLIAEHAQWALQRVQSSAQP